MALQRTLEAEGMQERYVIVARALVDGEEVDPHRFGEVSIAIEAFRVVGECKEEEEEGPHFEERVLIEDRYGKLACLDEFIDHARNGGLVKVLSTEETAPGLWKLHQTYARKIRDFKKSVECGLQDDAVIDFVDGCLADKGYLEMSVDIFFLTMQCVVDSDGVGWCPASVEELERLLKNRRLTGRGFAIHTDNDRVVLVDQEWTDA
jgi:hypothetical protein